MTMRGDWEQRKLDEREVSGTEQAAIVSGEVVPDRSIYVATPLGSISVQSTDYQGARLVGNWCVDLTWDTGDGSWLMSTYVRDESGVLHILSFVRLYR